ncbi:MAG TPA: hypothetical protein PKN87_02680 [Syntrophomonadaceae bacterium]|nr:hypothetical protein [Syntrophomonadaceae bacterium]HPR92508.1 hypothetical protein [Syntrophomonadaceae bacterium]
MLEEWVKKLTGNKAETSAFLKSKKSRYIIIIAICLGLLALVWDTSPGVDSNQAVNETAQPIINSNSVKEQLTRELGSILSQIEGAGQVKVSITLASDGEKSYASNITEEKSDIEETDSQGGKKQSAENKSTRELAVSSGNPLLIESKFPQVTGVLVVAEGAKDPAVKEKLAAATATLLDIPAHKVSIMPGQGGDL